jgi:hypothetical protein
MKTSASDADIEKGTGCDVARVAQNLRIREDDCIPAAEERFGVGFVESPCRPLKPFALTVNVAGIGFTEFPLKAA